jgi:hypothetical protein
LCSDHEASSDYIYDYMVTSDAKLHPKEKVMKRTTIRLLLCLALTLISMPLWAARAQLVRHRSANSIIKISSAPLRYAVAYLGQ